MKRMNFIIVLLMAMMIVFSGCQLCKKNPVPISGIGNTSPPSQGVLGPYAPFVAIGGLVVFAGGVGFCFINKGLGIAIAAAGLALAFGVAIYQALVQMIYWLVIGVFGILLIALIYALVKNWKYIKQLVTGFGEILQPGEKAASVGLNLTDDQIAKMKAVLSQVQDSDTKAAVDEVQKKSETTK